MHYANEGVPGDQAPMCCRWQAVFVFGRRPATYSAPRGTSPTEVDETLSDDQDRPRSEKLSCASCRSLQFWHLRSCLPYICSRGWTRRCYSPFRLVSGLYYVSSLRKLLCSGQDGMVDVECLSRNRISLQIFQWEDWGLFFLNTGCVTIAT